MFLKELFRVSGSKCRILFISCFLSGAHAFASSASTCLDALAGVSLSAIDVKISDLPLATGRPTGAKLVSPENRTFRVFGTKSQLEDDLDLDKRKLLLTVNPEADREIVARDSIFISGGVVFPEVHGLFLVTPGERPFNVPEAESLFYIDVVLQNTKEILQVGANQFVVLRPAVTPAWMIHHYLLGRNSDSSEQNFALNFIDAQGGITAVAYRQRVTVMNGFGGPIPVNIDSPQ